MPDDAFVRYDDSGEEWITALEASELVKCHRNTIINRISAGWYPGAKEVLHKGTKTYILPRSEVLRGDNRVAQTESRDLVARDDSPITRGQMVDLLTVFQDTLETALEELREKNEEAIERSRAESARKDEQTDLLREEVFLLRDEIAKRDRATREAAAHRSLLGRILRW